MHATGVLKDFGQMKESIPAELLKITQGIIIVPRLINGGFVIAAKRGKGIAMVKLPNGNWSNPGICYYYRGKRRATGRCSIS